MKNDSIINLPITLVYVIFPVVSLLGSLFFSIVVDYESVFLLLIFLIPLFARKRKISKRSFLFYVILFILVLVKYIIPSFVAWEMISIRPLIMDFKWIVYLFGGLFWIDLIGYPSKEYIWKSGVVFCLIYILYGIYMMLSGGDFNRLILISEANYDGFLILIPFCFVTDVIKKKKETFLFILATLLTGSRTGCMVLFVLLSYLLYKKKPFLILLIPPFLGICLYSLLSIRNSLDVESIDRYIFFYQSYLYFLNADISALLFGVSPGFSLNMPMLSSFEWYVDNFESMNNIVGVYSFYFHSAYLRFSIVWGVLSVCVVLIYSLLYFTKCRYVPLKLLLIVILLQSISLSTFTITNVSFILFIVLFVMLKEQRRIRKMPYNG